MIPLSTVPRHRPSRPSARQVVPPLPRARDDVEDDDASRTPSTTPRTFRILVSGTRGAIAEVDAAPSMTLLDFRREMAMAPYLPKNFVFLASGKKPVAAAHEAGLTLSIFDDRIVTVQPVAAHRDAERSVSLPVTPVLDTPIAWTGEASRPVARAALPSLESSHARRPRPASALPSRSSYFDAYDRSSRETHPRPSTASQSSRTSHTEEESPRTRGGSAREPAAGRTLDAFDSVIDSLRAQLDLRLQALREPSPLESAPVSTLSTPRMPRAVADDSTRVGGSASAASSFTATAAVTEHARPRYVRAADLARGSSVVSSDSRVTLQRSLPLGSLVSVPGVAAAGGSRFRIAIVSMTCDHTAPTAAVSVIDPLRSAPVRLTVPALDWTRCLLEAGVSESEWSVEGRTRALECLFAHLVLVFDSTGFLEDARVQIE